MTSRDIFSTVRSEGGLLPPDILRRIAEGDPGVGGLSPSDYHLEGEKINEAVNRSWNRAVAAWRQFRQAAVNVSESEPGTTVTRERWLLPLFNELGYGRLQTAKALEVADRSYAVSHLWHNTPLHLVGFRVDLDKRTQGVVGAARTTPHGLVQDLLNRSEAHLWAIVSNGLKLRLLRDSVALVRQAYVEFDLEAMMEGQVYADFVLLWQLCHQSRVEAPNPHECWLERWVKVADEQGTRALDHLRDGVEAAIVALGQGFLQHKGNRRLLERLRSGELSTQDYYRQILRMVYRLIFLFVAEDRDFLFAPGTSDRAKKRYREFYSTARMRALADSRRGSRHLDQWRALRLVFGMLKDDAGCPELGLPALNSFLWSPEATADLIASDISNGSLLGATRALAFSVEDGVRRAVDFRNLGPEELGSVYESLLELHPSVNADAGTFALAVAGGNERKTTGSFYTPDILIQRLLDSALDPLIDRAVRSPDAEESLLALKVLDPSCGSGHFLIAAAHRLAKRLASLRSGEDEPSPEWVRHALRDVIGRCLYGVDINPMAVELCKVSLWMEALEPGRPLSFLDHRIRVGNALVGATPSMLAGGLPDVAFDVLDDSDDKESASRYRKANRQQRDQEALSLFNVEGMQWGDERSIAHGHSTILAVDDSVVEGVHEMQRRFDAVLGSAAYARAKLVADAWCSTFFWPWSAGAPEPVLTEALYRARKDANAISREQRSVITSLSDEYRFFHWHLAFPDVFSVAPDAEGGASWTGGFDVILGNPPWDTLSPDAKEFFSQYDAAIRSQDRMGQSATIAGLIQDPTVALKWAQYRRQLYGTVHFLKDSGRYQLYAPGNLGKGDFNVYRMFVEMALSFTRQGGFAAQLVPEGLYSGANCMAIRQRLFDKCRLELLLGFENTKGVWFPGVHTAAKFVLYVAQLGGRTETFRAAFCIRSAAQLERALTGEALSIPITMVQEFSPDALAVMEFRDQEQVTIASTMYQRHPKFGDTGVSGPLRTYMREVDMGTDRDLFEEQPPGLPVYEGRMVSAFDHRAKGYRSGRGRSAEWADLPFGSGTKSIQPQWYIRQDRVPDKATERVKLFRAAFCDVASPTNERTLTATLLQPGAIAGHSVPTFTYAENDEFGYLVWLAAANSQTVDFLARMKVSLHMTFTTLDSLPFPRFPQDHPLVETLAPMVLKLLTTSVEMVPFWNKIAKKHGWVAAVPAGTSVPGVETDDERRVLTAEIEAVVARDVYGLTRGQLAYVLDTFPTLARRETEIFGEYRSKAMALAAFDRRQASFGKKE